MLQFFQIPLLLHQEPISRSAFSFMNRYFVLLVGKLVSRLNLPMELPNWIMAISQAHVFSSGRRRCAAFLANYHSNSAARVIFNNMHYNLPPWSISILPDCRNVVFNTARVSEVLAFIAIHVERKKQLVVEQLILCIILLDHGLTQLCPQKGWSSNFTNANVAS